MGLFFRQAKFTTDWVPFTTMGQNGVELKNNIKNIGGQYDLLHENIVGIDAAIFIIRQRGKHPDTWTLLTTR